MTTSTGVKKGYFFEDLAVGMEARYAKKITNDDVLAFAELSGDKNPVHLDDAYRRRQADVPNSASPTASDGEPVLHCARHQSCRGPAASDHSHN